MRRRFTINKGLTKTFDANNYLTIEALEDNFTVSFLNDIEYGIDGKGWIKLKAGYKTQSINAGQTLSFRGELTPKYMNGIGAFIINKKCNLKGNCMSMLFGDNAINNYSLSGKDFAFYKLFNACSNIVTVSENFLPATELAAECYDSMFDGCTSLIEAPQLPATTLVDSCYSRMFYYCTSLTSAPELPATKLAYNCYSSMFSGCTSLTEAPGLPVTTLAEQCYRYMFYSCTNLTTAPELPATTLVADCYTGMFSGCTSLTTAPELPATTLAIWCYWHMFNGCSNLNYIKMLATDISASSCLNYWVSGVSSSGIFVKHKDMTTLPSGDSGIPSGWTVEDYVEKIDYSKEYFTIEALEDGLTAKLSNNACEYLIDNGEWATLSANSNTPSVNKGQKISFKITNPTIIYEYGIGTFTISKKCNVEGNIMSLLYGDNFEGQTNLSGKKYAFSYLFSNCTTLQNAKNLILPAATLANECYYDMFGGCTSLTETPQLPATTLANKCYYSMFRNCTSLTETPQLPATTLVLGCYSSMFRNCTSLTETPQLPATTLANECYRYMFKGCSKLNYIKMLATDISASRCLNNWVDGVASSGTFVKHPDMITLPSGASGIPNGWTVVDN